MNSLATRLRAFVKGDQMAAEDLAGYEDVPRPAWLDRAAKDVKLSEYALEASKRSAEDAQAAVQRVQEKATQLLGTLMAAIPIGIAAAAFAVPKPLSMLGVVALLGTGVGVAFLVASAVVAGLASGLTIGGGLNIDRLDPENGATLQQLRATEADAWHFSAMLAMESGRRKAYDLFHARRAALFGVSLIAASVLVAIASGALG